MTTPPTDDPAASVAKLTEALRAERESHKSTKAQYLAPLRTLANLGDDADLDTLTSTLAARLGDADKVVSERTAALESERDEAVAKAAKIEQAYASEKVTAALDQAFAASGAQAQNAEDYLALARPLFTLGDDGQVVTRADAPNTVPGMTPDQWISAQLRQARPHWWPLSTGGGARGTTGTAVPTSAGDSSCFNPRSPNHSITNQFLYEQRFGKAAADAAIARFRGAR